jgi:hypothetical protein
MADDTVVMLPAEFTVTIAGVETTAQVSEATVNPEELTSTVRTLKGETDYSTGTKFTLTVAAYADWQLPAVESLGSRAPALP